MRRPPFPGVRVPPPVLLLVLLVLAASIAIRVVLAGGIALPIDLQPAQWPTLQAMLVMALVLGLTAGLVFLIVRRVRLSGRMGLRPSGARQAAGQGGSRTFLAERPSTRFSDVAGAAEAKEELGEVVDFLRAPARFASVGARPPKGVLLVGPPGTGKTLLARAIAGEAEAPFLSAAGAEFVEVYVGVGASRVRSLFREAKKHAPCIVFVDEIDAVGRRRGGQGAYTNEEREQTLNQLLVELDGFDQQSNVVVIAATNRADILDPALLRPGRFDRQVMMDHPDFAARLAILKVHGRNKPLADNVDLETIARQTAGLSGADLENVMNEAAILLARREGDSIAMVELEEAVDRVVAGPRRKSRVLNRRELEITAYHEMGHALVAWTQPRADKVEKVSIVSRGMMGGYTRLVPEEDRHLWTRSEFEAAMASALGGYAAEKLVFGEVTTGASNDLQKAAAIARGMVTEYGMSQSLGPLALSSAAVRPGEGPPSLSPELARLVDDEVRQLVDTAHRTAGQVLLERRDTLESAARLLLERETLEGEELSRILSCTSTTSASPTSETIPA